MVFYMLALMLRQLKIKMTDRMSILEFNFGYAKCVVNYCQAGYWFFTINLN